MIKKINNSQNSCTNSYDYMFAGGVCCGKNQNGADRGGQKRSGGCCGLGKDGFSLSWTQNYRSDHIHHQGLTSREYTTIICSDMSLKNTCIRTLMLQR